MIRLFPKARSAGLVLIAVLACTPWAHARKPDPPRELALLSTAVESLSEQVDPAIVEVVVTGFSLTQRRGGGVVSPTLSGGSGVIVDAEGYIVTNAHVVEGASEIKVRLAPPANADRGSVLPAPAPMLSARLLGVDRETDLAVLKIEGGPFSALAFGDSERVRPGRLVFAFGSPLGLENSVSMGVVSAVARQLAPDAPMIYIQTDAAINPGNSGGALVDVTGELIGINTMIYSKSGGNEGIGFAAPAHIVKTIYQRIREQGRMRRGIIAASAQTITPEIARGLTLPVREGVILADVYPGGPADRAGLRVGDIILGVDGKAMENARQMDVNVYLKSIGTIVDIDLLRDGERLTLPVRVIERKEFGGPFAERVSVDESAVRALGIVAVSLGRDIAGLLPDLRRDAGVVVAAQTQGGGAVTPLRSGDVIYSLNGQPTGTLDELRGLLAGRTAGETVVLQVERQGRLHYVVAPLQ